MGKHSQTDVLNWSKYMALRCKRFCVFLLAPLFVFLTLKIQRFYYNNTAIVTKTRIRDLSNAGPKNVGAISPPRVRVVSEELFGNQFYQFVVIFLLQGLRNSSAITNLSPRTVNVSAQFALTNQPSMTLILVSLPYVRRIQT